MKPQLLTLEEISMLSKRIGVSDAIVIQHAHKQIALNKQKKNTGVKPPKTLAKKK